MINLSLRNEINKFSVPNIVTITDYYGPGRESIKLVDFDIVLTTYSTLGCEVYKALQNKGK